MMIPFIIGVGCNIYEEKLTQYSEKFTDGFFRVDGKREEVDKKLSVIFKCLMNVVRENRCMNYCSKKGVYKIREIINEGINNV